MTPVTERRTLPAVRRVAVIMAMEAEAAPLREALGARPTDSPAWAGALPCRLAVASATQSRPEIVLAVNGTDPRTGVDCIGSTAAALTTHTVLAAYSATRIDLVLSVGTAGGWTRAGAQVGDVYMAWDRFVCHDRRIDIPGFDVLGRADIPAADLREHAAALGCRTGIVSTGDSLDETPVDRERMRASGAEVKEMEAAAVAWVAHLHGVPVGGVKAITDLVDSPVSTPDQFTANLTAAVGRLRETTVALLDRLGAQP